MEEEWISSRELVRLVQSQRQESEQAIVKQLAAALRVGKVTAKAKVATVTTRRRFERQIETSEDLSDWPIPMSCWVDGGAAEYKFSMRDSTFSAELEADRLVKTVSCAGVLLTRARALEWLEIGESSTPPPAGVGIKSKPGPTAPQPGPKLDKARWGEFAAAMTVLAARGDLTPDMGQNSIYTMVTDFLEVERGRNGGVLSQQSVAASINLFKCWGIGLSAPGDYDAK